jgi:16S rRNA (adenine1518-N6/adenine1519-N6)-dimethyltransferase
LVAVSSRRRIAEFGVRPRRELGQNFLIDVNILDVIGRAARLSSGDVVLEIGGGLGVLSEYLAAHAAHVHVVEVDRRLEPALRDAVGDAPNVTLHFTDALELDLAALDPAPDKVIANLPYSIAATAILRTIEELPGVSVWIAMVQREVGERFAAGPGDEQYGIPSVLAQLACDVRVLRPVARTVFYPVPKVDSVLVELRRRSTAAAADVRLLVQAAFAHRRKSLARSLATASGDRSVVEQARAALERMGHPADERAERLSPAEFVALAEALR